MTITIQKPIPPKRNQLGIFASKNDKDRIQLFVRVSQLEKDKFLKAAHLCGFKNYGKFIRQIANAVSDEILKDDSNGNDTR